MVSEKVNISMGLSIALLRPDGHLYLEINERFGPAVAALFPGSRVLPDLSGRDRFVVR